MNFKPWDEQKYKKSGDMLDIKEPPCAKCINWSPQSIYVPAKTDYIFDSVRLCWSESMHHDFSCYEKKE